MSTEEQPALTRANLGRLKKLCAEWYSIRGEKPYNLSRALNELVEREYDKFRPPEFQTTGFDRQ